MSRAPFQVLVFPYHRAPEGGLEYAIFRRSDAGYWQAISGGGEDGETPLEAARREAYEEADIPQSSAFLPLDTLDSVPVTEFADSHLWGNEVYVIPQYCFGVLAQTRQMVLSDEHTEYRWLTYDDAYNLLRYDSNKTALWELDRRLRGRGPRG
jgi:dATP pyrophosphohydrolase